MFRNPVDVPEWRRATLAEGLAQTAGEYAVLPFLAPAIPVSHHEIRHLSDDQIMSIPPHVAIHAMRTAASGGTQVISPRQIPSCTIVKRTSVDSSQSFVHMVASEADKVRSWPKLPGESAAPLAWTANEPLLKCGSALATRRPATSAPLTYETRAVSNPFHKAWIKMRANCDFQRRDDVGGDGDALAEAYSKTWGLPNGVFHWPGTISFAHLTPLREHAISVDSAFARTLATIQERRVVAVAVLTSSASAFGPDRTIDWNCMRVSCEAKYMLTLNNEHHSFVNMSIAPTYMVGNLGPPPRPRGIMAYHPNYATAWYYGAETFALNPVGVGSMAVTPMSMVACQEFGVHGRRVADGAILAMYSMGLRMVSTSLNRMEQAGESAFTTGILVVANAVSDARSVARSADRALASWVYDAVIASPAMVKVKFLRVLMAVTQAIERFNGDITPDNELVSDLAKNMVQLDGCIALRMSAMAVSRGESSHSWYRTLVAQLPEDARDDAPNTRAWAWMAMRFVLFPPNDRWRGLLGALNRNAADIMTPGTITMPAYTGLSPMEGRTAALLRARSILATHKTMYFASYDGVARASHLLARLAVRSIRYNLARALEANAYCWTLRARAIRTVNVNVAELIREYPPNCMWMEFDGNEEGAMFPASVWITIAPYSAYRAWKKGCDAAGLPTARACPDNVEAGLVTAALAAAQRTFGRMCFDSPDVYNEIVNDPPDAVRYAVNPARLGPDIERFLTLTAQDAIAAVRSVWSTMMPPVMRDPVADAGDDPAINVFNLAEDFDAADLGFGDEEELDETQPQNGWFWMSQMDQLVADAILEDILSNQRIATVLEGFHANYDEFDVAMSDALGDDPNAPPGADNVLIG